MQSLWMLVAALLFSLMSVGVKLASSYYSTSEIVAYRGGIGMLLIYALIRWQGGSLRTNMPGHHLWRGVVGVAALWMWFYAIGRMPLAMAVTLNYMSPIWIAAIFFVSAWWHQRKQLEWGLLIAIILGFVGVVILLRPSIHSDQWLAGVVALVSGMLAALAYIQVREMGLRGEPEYRVVFYFSTTCTVAGLIGTLVLGWFQSQGAASIWHTHQLQGIAILLVVGLTAALAQMAMTRAYRLGNPLVTANLQYVGIVFSSLWDLLLWHDPLSFLSWLGIIIILGSGVMASYFNVKHRSSKMESDPISNE